MGTAEGSDWTGQRGPSAPSRCQERPEESKRRETSPRTRPLSLPLGLSFLFCEHLAL